MLDAIEYLPIKNEFHVGDVKNLAVTTSNKEDMSKDYKAKSNVNAVSNADMLSQSFGGNTVPEISQPVETVSVEPIQISAIPGNQNTSSLESSPVDLKVSNTVGVGESIPMTEKENINEMPNLNIPTMDNINNVVNNPVSQPQIPVIEPIVPSTPTNGGIDSGFKVTNEPNIFDNPIPSISQEEINKPFDQVVPSVVGNENVLEKSEEIQNVKEEKNPKVLEESIDDEIVLAQIAIEESNIKHYEALVENSRKKVELLKRQIKHSKNEEVNLENTASNLFNNNGVLDEERVLGKTPFPNINIA